MEFDRFQTKVWKSGTSLVITIPDKVAKYSGYQPGTILKVVTRKHSEE